MNPSYEIQAMSYRFYVQPPVSEDEATLAGPEAHHLIHVMRAQVGQEIMLFDGIGAEYQAIVTQLSRQSVTASIRQRREVDRELPFALTLAVALPKGDRQKMLVEKATELGVTKLIPLITERSVAQPTGPALERLRRGVIEACKQCGRNRLLEICEPRKLGELLATQHASVLRLLAHPSGDPISPIVDRAGGDCELLVGPEGGFSDEEVADALAAGATTVCLGPRILRIETAAIALASIIAASRQ